MRTRALGVLVCLAGLAAIPSVELELPFGQAGPPAAADECVAHVIGPTGDLRLLDPLTLNARGPIVIDAPPIQSHEVRLGGGTWSHATGIQVLKRSGTVTSIESHEAARDEWYVSIATSALRRYPACDAADRVDDTAYALLATGGRPEPTPTTGLPASGPSDPNVFVAALSLDGVERWRAAIPARAGYYLGPSGEFRALRPAAAVSPAGGRIAVIHSELDGSDHLSLIDVRTGEVQTTRFRDERMSLRLGAAFADAKMVERRKAWSPRFVDERFLYAVLHETRTDELGELSVILIDTNDARVVARWPERGPMAGVRATLADWTVVSGSVYLTGREKPGSFTLYRLDARDLRLLAQRSLDALPLIRAISPTK
jgi:hypothetical protein